MGSGEKEESHVQTQVLDEQGDRHRQEPHTHTHAGGSLIMVHGMLDIMSLLASVCLSVTETSARQE